MATAVTAACAAPHLPPGKSSIGVSEAERVTEIARAAVWAPTDIPAMDLKAGPQGKGAVAPFTALTCDYVQKDMGGTSPKFACQLGPDDVVKIKYGKSNPEVYGVVAASRLFWALGFGADRWYPVSVTCHRCPRDPHTDKTPSIMTVSFPIAALERTEAGRTVETYADQGWAWPELIDVSAEAGGAPQEQREALELLAIMIQHTDSKPEQQRLVCQDQVKGEAGDGIKDEGHGQGKSKAADKAPGQAPAKSETKAVGDRALETPMGSCQMPFMYVHDLGLTFGHRTLANANQASGPNFQNWASTRVWQTTAHGHCVGNMLKSWSGTLEYPVIHEAGRHFLATLLTQLSDQQLLDLFDIARFPDYSHVSADRWVGAFKDKRQQIVDAHCGAETTTSDGK
jgi:hypothetical protein